MAGLAVLILGRHAFRNPSRRRARRTTGALVATAGEDQRGSATQQLQKEGTVNNLAWLTTWPENRWFTTPQEAVIDLPSLEFRGKAFQDVRTALNQGAKMGITHRLTPLLEQPRGIQMQVRAISSDWVEDKGMPEMGFAGRRRRSPRPPCPGGSGRRR